MAGHDDIKRTRVERVVLWLRCAASADTAESSHLAGAVADAEALASEFEDQTLARVRAAGAEILVSIGGSIVGAFDSIEIEDAVELSRGLVDDAERAGGACNVSVGVALGDVEEHMEPGTTGYRGAVIDRAQVLSNRARPGEVVLDDAARQAASEYFLFAREVSSQVGRGYALDPTHARKSECRTALSRLVPAPLPASMLPLFEALRDAIEAPEPARIVLHATLPATPLEVLERLALTMKPPLLLRMSRRAGGLEPLGCLALSLERLGPEAGSRDPRLPAETRQVLQDVQTGAPVARAQVVKALLELLAAARHDGARPWIVLDQLQELDPATLGVLAETLLASDADVAVFMTLPTGASVPAALLPEEQVQSFTLEPLKLEERRAIAEAVLGLVAGSEIAQRVAALGGESVLGIVEAARTLISAGDLVLRGEDFVWRKDARSSGNVVPVESLITERVAGLLPSAFRLLEVLAVAAPNPARELVEDVLGRDGSSKADLALGLAQLEAEAFVDAQLSLGAADTAVRAALRNQMPPARAAELHRFLAEALRARLLLPGFGSAQLAYHLAEGGQEPDAARALVDAARAAAEAGFSRMALRLLAAAVEIDGSPEIRAAASETARALDALAKSSAEAKARAGAAPRATRSDIPAAHPKHLADKAIAAARKALLERDRDAVERWLDAAVAAGFGHAAAQRLLALSQLTRGDVPGATRTLTRGSSPDAPAEVLARDALCRALLLLCDGEPESAVREALHSLAENRALADRAGEIASLAVLTRCYQQLGREADASRIATAASALS